MKPVSQVLLVISILLLAGCKDTWEAFIYPDKNDLTSHRNLGQFSSLEECRNAALGLLEELHASDAGDYECGKNCDDGSEMGGIQICQETLR